MERIGVFLSSKDNVPESYKAAAHEVGRWIGQSGRTLVYGGSASGLMEEIARSVKESGGRVFGVIPQIVCDRGLESSQIDITFYCNDLGDRKSTMMRESELFVALPGGIGTVDEVMTVIATGTIGMGRKTVVLYNVDGCWDSLLAFINNSIERGLTDKAVMNHIKVATTTQQLEEIARQG